MSLPSERSSLRRGVRRCAGCGTYNGNRAGRCRNKECGVSLIRGKGLTQPSVPAATIDGTDTFFSNILNSFDTSNNSNLSFNDAFVESMVEELRVEEGRIQEAPHCVEEGKTCKKNTVVVAPPIDNSPSLSFLQWLSSVTERINQAMHFYLQGKPEPLVFHIPEIFFEHLHRRMSPEVAEGGSQEKKRLPNKTCVFVRRDTAPLGKFTIYIWHLYSLTLLSRVFDTSQIKLQIMKHYKQNKDGSYTECTNMKENNINNVVQADARESARQRIAPGKLLTFIKVGKNPGSDVPFTIEWIPNILPITKVGELRIKFQFGHKSN